MTAADIKGDAAPGVLWESAAADRLLGAVPTDEIRGTVLVAELGESVFAGAVLDRCANARRVMLVDADADRLDAGRRALSGADVPTFFASESVNSLSFAPGVFGAAFCVRRVVTAADALNVLASLSERVRPGGWVGIAAFGEVTLTVFDEMLSEAVHAARDDRLLSALNDHRERRVRANELAGAAETCGLEDVTSGAVPIPVAAGAEALMMTQLVALDLAPAWRAVDESVRELGTSYGEAVMRLRTYFDGAPVEDLLEMAWVVGRVREDEILDIDDDDVVAIEG